MTCDFFAVFVFLSTSFLNNNNLYIAVKRDSVCYYYTKSLQYQSMGVRGGRGEFVCVH